MGAISPIHIAIVVIIALLVFGPKRIPELGKSIGSALHEFQKGTAELRDSLGIDGIDLGLNPKDPKQIDAASTAMAATVQPPAETAVPAASTVPAASVQAPPPD